MAAVKAENGAALLKLYTEALAHFEEERVTFLNPALTSRPRFMALEAPPSGPPRPELEGPPSALPDLDEGFDPLPDPDALPASELSMIDLLEEGLSDPEAWASLSPAKPKSFPPLAKARSKLAKKSIKPTRAPGKLVRLKPRRDS